MDRFICCKCGGSDRNGGRITPKGIFTCYDCIMKSKTDGKGGASGKADVGNSISFRFRMPHEDISSSSELGITSPTSKYDDWTFEELRDEMVKSGILEPRKGV